ASWVRSAAHGRDDRAGAHIRPVRVDELGALLLAALLPHLLPAIGAKGGGGPQRVLALIVDQDDETAVGVVERVGRHGAHLCGPWSGHGVPHRLRRRYAAGPAEAGSGS